MLLKSVAMRYAVVIPVYNERELFPLLLERLLATPPVVSSNGEPLTREVVVVDDGSTDGTREYVSSLREKPGIHCVLHDRNHGKGAAVRTGFQTAIALGVDIVLIQDADLEYEPRDHARLLEPILDGRADAVFGSRFLGETHRVLYYWHAVANRLITQFSNMVTNLNLTDIECCLKAFSRRAAEQITIRENRFGVEPELIAKVARMRLPCGETAHDRNAQGLTTNLRYRRARVYEVGVSYAGRTYEEGKKITWRDGFSALRCIVKYGLFSR